jgi:hypothetical protein
LYRQIDLPIQPDDPPTFEWITNRLQQEVDTLPHAGLQLLRIRLHGHSRDPEALRDCVRSLEDWSTPGLAVETVTFDVHPELNLQEIAEAGPVPSLLCQALDTPPPELKKRIDSLCQSLSLQTEFRDKSLPPIESGDIPLTELIEKALHETLRQLS